MLNMSKPNKLGIKCNSNKSKITKLPLMMLFLDLLRGKRSMKTQLRSLIKITLSQ